LNFLPDSESAILFFKTAAFNQLGHSSVLESSHPVLWFSGSLVLVRIFVSLLA
jgi:hypothetical protein